MSRGPVVDKTFVPDIPEFHGVAFTRIGKALRSVFRQTNGDVILADECKCVVEFTRGRAMSVKRILDCPVDEHKIRALQTGGDF